MRNRLVALSAALAVIAGCGGGDDDGPSTVDPLPFGELIAHLPADQRKAIALDVAGARRELGLGREAAPPAPPDFGNDGTRRLRALVAATVGNYPIRDNGPLDRAIDYRQVTAVVRADRPPAVLLVATREPWKDLRASLERHGWRPRSDGVLERPAGARTLRWVAGRDGFAVAAGDPRAARAALSRRSRSPVIELLRAATGPSRAARLADDARCITGVAAGYSPASASGQFVVAVREVPPQPFRLRERLGLDTQQPRAAGGRVVVPFAYEATTDAARQPAARALASSGQITYACRRRG
jgi:hypothetical protein